MQGTLALVQPRHDGNSPSHLTLRALQRLQGTFLSWSEVADSAVQVRFLGAGLIYDESKVTNKIGLEYYANEVEEL